MQPRKIKFNIGCISKASHFHFPRSNSVTKYRVMCRNNKIKRLTPPLTNFAGETQHKQLTRLSVLVSAFG